MNTNISNLTSQNNTQTSTSVPFGSRGELVWEAKLGANRIIVLKYTSANGQTQSYVAEINKDESTQLLVLPGSVCYLKSQTKLSLDHYGLRESGVSGFIKSQVTGESFVMTEIKGAGTIRQTPNADCLGVKLFNNTKLCLPNINITYLQALLGKFEISPPQKSKSDLPIIYTEIKFENALALVENDNFYQIQVTPGNPVCIESNEIIFWTGELMLEEDKTMGNGEGNLTLFSGSGNIYLSLST